MDKLTTYKKLLQKEKPYFKKKYGVKSLAIFGSYSQNKATVESDIDVLVEFEQPIGLAFVDLAEELEDLLGIKVDLVSKNGVKERYMDEIKQDLVYV